MDKEIGPLFADKPEPSRPFRLPSGAHETNEKRAGVNQPIDASRRSERGKRIAGDVRRMVLFGFVLVGVGIVLAMFVSVTLVR